MSSDSTSSEAMPIFFKQVVQLAFGRIAFWFTVDELFKNFFGAIQLPVGDQRVSELGKSIGQAEGVAGTAIAVDQPFMGLDAAGQTHDQFIQQAADGFVLAGIEHGDTSALDDGHGLFALPGLQHGFGNFLRKTKILFVRFENSQGQRSGFFPIHAFKIKIQKQLGLFAALFEVGNIFEEFRRLGDISARRIRARLDDDSSQILRINL